MPSGSDSARLRRRNLIVSAAIVALLGCVYFLPPDTSLAQMEQSGVLRVCAPPTYPPLIMREVDAPGFEVELLEAVADRMGVRLLMNTNPAIGRDFNPRNWRVTRAQCQLLAGGVVVSDLTRSFLDTTSPHLETGWAIVRATGEASSHDGPVVFYSGLTGLDRIALSRLAREKGKRVEIANDKQAFVEALRSGLFSAGISEAITAREIAGDNGWQAEWLSPDLEHYPVAFGLWKGDLTLKRKVLRTLAELQREGLNQRLLEKYHIVPLADAAG